MAASRFVNPDARPLPLQLATLIYSLAQDGADEELGEVADELWAALLRDGRDIADRARDLVHSDTVDVRPDEIDDEAWAQLESAAGVIVTRNSDGSISVQSFRDGADLAASWNALAVELSPAEPGSQWTRTPESDENPT